MSQTVQAALAEALPRLRAAGVEDPARDARRLMVHALGVGADRLILHLPEPLAPDAAARFAAAVAARCARQPVAQITGRRAFWGREFRVTPDVLDPRPETEALVACALERPFATVLDLGVGSGAILLTLLAEHATARGVGADFSAPALDVARENARALGVAERARFVLSDWFMQVEGRFDLIVANPPYVSQAEYDELAPEPQLWEPRIALTPGGDGLAAYRAITAQAPRHLAPGGWLMVETGPSQGAAVAGLMRAAGLEQISVCPDLDGRDRVVMGRKVAENGVFSPRIE